MRILPVLVDLGLCSVVGGRVQMNSQFSVQLSGVEADLGWRCPVRRSLTLRLRLW